MTTTSPQHATTFDVASVMGAIYSDGILGLKGAFERDWVARLHEDVLELYDEALQHEGGAVGRGPRRHYVEIHPERIRGFADIVMHPWFEFVCEAVLGPDYKVVEIGFDVPNPGSVDQPWHRDFPAPHDTTIGRRINSLAFNITTVDVHEDMGPFEIAPGTQWDDAAEFEYEMFPLKSSYDRYEARREQKLPQMGDVSVRSALTIHRGTANRSQTARPVLVVGVDAPGANNDERHDLQFTRRYFDTLPVRAQARMQGRLVDELEQIVQGHSIEGLMMGEA